MRVSAFVRSVFLLGLVQVLLALTLLPGLDAGFRLDDGENLRLVEMFDEQRPFASLQKLVELSPSGPTGRPISMLTFVLQKDAWPGNPGQFLAVNLLLHLVAGLLVFGFLRELLRQVRKAPDSSLPLAIAVLWLVHPLNTQVVFYAVQRMTILATLFGIAALWAFLLFRRYVDTRQAKRAVAVGMASAFLLTAGLLSKENAVLILPMMLVLDHVLPSKPRFRTWNIISHLGLAAAVVAFVFGPALLWSWLLEASQGRAFSPGQRVVTEFAVLVDYVRLLVLPQESVFRPFYTNYPLAGDGLAPLKIFAGMALVIALAVLVFFHRRWPLVAAGAAMFLVGHLLESTWLPLEIYFEHRNYLPSIGWMLLVVAVIGELWALQISSDTRKALLVAAALYVGLLLVVGWQLAERVGKPLVHATLTVQENPGSLRARDHLGTLLLNSGYYDAAYENYERMVELGGDQDVGGYYLMLQLNCRDASQPTPDAGRVIELSRTARREYAPLLVLRRIADYRQAGECLHLDDQVLRAAALALADNPAFASFETELRSLAVQFSGSDP